MVKELGYPCAWARKDIREHGENGIQLVKGCKEGMYSHSVPAEAPLTIKESEIAGAHYAI